jgi:hypothetical protein
MGRESEVFCAGCREGARLNFVRVQGGTALVRVEGQERRLVVGIGVRKP